MKIDLNNIPSPCFVLDKELLDANLKKIKHVQETAEVDIILALKGYAFWHTFPQVKKNLKGAAASSLNEALLINDKMGCKAHTYAPVYKEEEFSKLLSLSSHITFNTLSQHERFQKEISRSEYKPLLGLRINPQYSEVKTDLYNPGAADSRLGITRGELGERLPEGISGLHFHLLCENDSYVLERTLKAVENNFAPFLRKIKWLNMGGGHLITHKNYDVPHLLNTIKKFKERYQNIEKIILEPGGAIGWQTGYLVATIEDIIKKPDFTWAMLDVSFAAHMPDCLEMPYKPAIQNASDALNHKENVYRIGGNTCLAGDFMGMGDYRFERELKIGDKIVFEDMIHYTMVKTTFFNGVKHPSIGIWTKKKKFKLLREFGYDDYKDKLS